MKITKTCVTVFLATFLIGYVSVLPIKKLSPPVETSILSQEKQPSQAEPKTESPIIEEVIEWDEEDESEPKIKLLETGDGFHGDQIKAKSGETWTGLFKENNHYFLRSTKIKISRVEDPIVDDAGEKTGKSVAAADKSVPLFLMKNATMLRDGNITTLYHFDENEESNEQSEKLRSLRTGFSREFQMSGKTYFLKVKRGRTKSNETISALVLESEGRSQTLHSKKNPEEEDYLGELYWVGDLDGDGNPDFYFSLFIHENADYKNLFLSSEARKGKLVKKVATFITSGC